MQHILTGCYIAKPDVETFARNTHALILKKNAGRKKVNEKTFKTKAAAEKYFNKLLGN